MNMGRCRPTVRKPLTISHLQAFKGRKPKNYKVKNLSPYRVLALLQTFKRPRKMQG